MACGRLEESGGHDVGQVHMQMRQVEKEGTLTVFPEEADGRLGVAFGEGCLIGLFLQDLVVPEQWKGGISTVFQTALSPHVVGIGKSEVTVETVAGGKKLRLVAAMPFADQHGGITSALQQGGDGFLLRVEAHTLPGKEHAMTLEIAEAYAGRQATGQQGATRRRTDRRGLIKIGEEQALRGQAINGRGAVSGGTVTTQITIAQIVAIDEDDIGAVGHARRRRRWAARRISKLRPRAT